MMLPVSAAVFELASQGTSEGTHCLLHLIWELITTY